MLLSECMAAPDIAMAGDAVGVTAAESAFSEGLTVASHSEEMRS